MTNIKRLNEKGVLPNTQNQLESRHTHKQNRMAHKKDPQKLERWVALISYLVNASGSVRALHQETGIPASTIQAWVRNGSICKTRDHQVALAKVSFPRIDAEGIDNYLRGEITLQEMLGADWVEKYAKPRRTRREAPGVRRANKALRVIRSNPAKSVVAAKPQKTTITVPQQSLLLAPSPLPSINEIAQLSIERFSEPEKLLLLKALVESLLIECSAPRVPQHFSEWLRGHLVEQSVPESTFVRQVVSVLRRRKVDEVDAATLARQWISGEALPDADGIDCLSLVLRDGDDLPIEVSDLCRLIYPESNYPSSEIADLCSG